MNRIKMKLICIEIGYEKSIFEHLTNYENSFVVWISQPLHPMHNVDIIEWIHYGKTDIDLFLNSVLQTEPNLFMDPENVPLSIYD